MAASKPPRGKITSRERFITCQHLPSQRAYDHYSTLHLETKAKKSY